MLLSYSCHAENSGKHISSPRLTWAECFLWSVVEHSNNMSPRNSHSALRNSFVPHRTFGDGEVVVVTTHVEVCMLLTSQREASKHMAAPSYEASGVEDANLLHTVSSL